MQSNSFISALLKSFMAIAITAAITACGGGGGDAVKVEPPIVEKPTIPEEPVSPEKPPIVEKPTILEEPVSQSVVVGQVATFTVKATGSEEGGALTYQWKNNGTDIPGATDRNYSQPTTETDINNRFAFSVAVTNSAGTVVSNPGNPATLTVTTTALAPTIHTHPAAPSVVIGQTAQFSVKATGTAPLRYQWKRDGSIISGATTDTYTLQTSTSTDNAAVFTVDVSNSTGIVTSNNAMLTVTPAPVAPFISVQPTAQLVATGQRANFSVTAIGTLALHYQWKRNGSNISGATSDTYTLQTSTNADNAAVFTVDVSNSAGTVTSNRAILSVLPILISTQPSDQTVPSGNTARFSVAATATGPLTYQWKKDGDDVSGATDSSYTTPATTNADNGAAYSVVVSDGQTSVTSNSATLAVSRFSLVLRASGSPYLKTECVRDNRTGLIWEGKNSSDRSIRRGSSTYSNFDNTASAQKQNASTPSQAEIDAPTNSIGYITSVNAGGGLCGFTDWRLPTLAELQGILDRLNAADLPPRIDATWFPNTAAQSHLTSTPSPVYPATAVWLVSFNSGLSNDDGYRDVDYVFHIRLVRCGAATCTSN